LTRSEPAALCRIYLLEGPNPAGGNSPERKKLFIPLSNSSFTVYNRLGSFVSFEEPGPKARKNKESTLWT
jgi:hypothetical protein